MWPFSKLGLRRGRRMTQRQKLDEAFLHELKITRASEHRLASEVDKLKIRLQQVEEEKLRLVEQYKERDRFNRSFLVQQYHQKLRGFVEGRRGANFKGA